MTGNAQITMVKPLKQDNHPRIPQAYILNVGLGNYGLEKSCCVVGGMYNEIPNCSKEICYEH